jgi:metal-responsive CopG/Arc/MetJ family transcriptional regulator
MATVSLKLSEELLARLTAEARKRGVSRSAFVREVLETHLRAPDVSRSAAELAGELVGCVDGPEDLSTSWRHLDGFGE